MSQSENSNEKTLKIRRGKVDSLSLYEITEQELNTLEKGAPAGLFLNYGIALLSLSCSFLIALLTTNIDSERTFVVFAIIVIAGFIGSIILMCLWYRNRQSISELVKEIKSRIPDEESEPSEQDKNTE